MVFSPLRVSRGATVAGVMSNQQGDLSDMKLRVRRPRLASQILQLDDAQQAAVRHRGSPIRVIGAPGTGKTTVLIESVVSRVDEGLDPAQVLVLTPTRPAAARLRDRLTGRLSRTLTTPLVRTPQAFAFSILRLAAARADGPSPRLITGPEQDVILRDLLAGHIAGVGAAPQWPAHLQPALPTRGFRTELRDLLMRAIERGIFPPELAELGRQHDRPEWVCGAQVFDEYLNVTALGSPGGYDPAAIVSAAVESLRADDFLLNQTREQIRFIAMDDAQEATPAIAELVHLVRGGSPNILLVGDADVTTLGFRGADPLALLDDAPTVWASSMHCGGAGRSMSWVANSTSEEVPVTTVRLKTAWRYGSELGAGINAVAAKIGARLGVRHRVPTPAPTMSPGEIRIHVMRSTAHEEAVIAEALRRQHLMHEVPWSELAVIVRSGAAAARLRQGLLLAGVPVHVSMTDLPLREQPSVTPLLSAFEFVLGAVGHHGQRCSVDDATEDSLAEHAVALLASPLGGADALTLRNLRRALIFAERDGGGERPADILIMRALLDPALLSVVDTRLAAPARRVARVVAAGVALFAGSQTPHAEDVLWALWSAAGLAEPWCHAALRGGPSGARADRDLDAVVALFDAAARFADRLPSAGPRQFLDYVQAQELPGDSLAAQGNSGGAVTVLTPASAVGQQWSVVIVASVQDGNWPDLRPRGSLLGADYLVDVLMGRHATGPAELARSRRAAVRDEETRLFHVAISRARCLLIVTAVRDEDQQPSPFLDLLDPSGISSVGSPHVEATDGIRALTPMPLPLSLAGVIARLRQQLTNPATPPPTATAAASQLARLAQAGVPGAHPDDWSGLAPISDAQPLHTQGALQVSPSAIEEFDRCALRWLLQRSGGRSGDSPQQGLGVLIHALAAEFPTGTLTELRAELHRRWTVLGWGPGWVGDVGRARAERITAKLATYLASRTRELIGTELPIDITIPPEGLLIPARQLGAVNSSVVRVVGRADRVERDEHGLYVIDLKTGGTAIPMATVTEHPQLGAYQLAVQAGAFADITDGIPAGAELIQLGTPSKTPRVHVQPSLSEGGGWARELIARVATGMSDASFTAAVNETCDRCPVRTSCPARPEGRRVVSP
ncbi:MAG: ATP-dependent helicase [Actinomycetota bacterium]